MIGALAGLFTAAVQLTGLQRSLLILPLCLSIAIVYKTTRCDKLSDVPVAALLPWITIVLGMYAVGLGVWVTFQIMV